MVWADWEASTEAAYEPALKEARSKPVIGLAAQRRMLAVVLVPWPVDQRSHPVSPSPPKAKVNEPDAPGMGIS
jgi:hypothetical protein